MKEKGLDSQTLRVCHMREEAVGRGVDTQEVLHMATMAACMAIQGAYMKVIDTQTELHPMAGDNHH